MKPTFERQRCVAALFVAMSMVAGVASADIPYDMCSWYPGSTECICTQNPYDVVCGGTNWANDPWHRNDQIPPDPAITEHFISHVAANPYHATCNADQALRTASAYYDILFGVEGYNGDLDVLSSGAGGGDNNYFYTWYDDGAWEEFQLLPVGPSMMYLPVPTGWKQCY